LTKQIQKTKTNYCPIVKFALEDIVKRFNHVYNEATHKGDTIVKFESIFLEKQDAMLSAWIDTNNQKTGPRFVTIEDLDNTRNHN